MVLGEGPDDRGIAAGRTYRLDLERWWALVEQHLAHPSADLAVLHLTPSANCCCTAAGTGPASRASSTR